MRAGYAVNFMEGRYALPRRKPAVLSVAFGAGHSSDRRNGVGGRVE